MSEEIKKGQVYKHCKGKKYLIEAVARDSSSCEVVVVVYKSLEDSEFPKGTIWIRNLDEFTDNHRSGVKRFTLVDDSDSNTNYGLLPAPLPAQEGLNMLKEHFLGKEWYAVMSMPQVQVNAEVVHTIMHLNPKKKTFVDKVKQLSCKFMKHKLITIKKFNTNESKVFCLRCKKYFALNHEQESFLVWDDEFEKLYAD